jgi:hypothetical protein
VEQPLLEFQNDEKFKMRFANISKMRSGQKIEACYSTPAAVPPPAPVLVASTACILKEVARRPWRAAQELLEEL